MKNGVDKKHWVKEGCGIGMRYTCV